jgi:hypothetical protein
MEKIPGHNILHLSQLPSSQRDRTPGFPSQSRPDVEPFT